MPILIGHRGAPLRLLENTVDSLRLARELGADAVEFDVRASRDGHPVLLHDRTLERFWGHPSPVGELTVAELRELRCAEHPTARIATLEEVAEKVDLRLVVDGKDPALVPAIVEILRRHGALGRSCFIGAPDVLGVVRDALPDAEIILSWSGTEPPGRDLLDRLRPSTINLPWKGFPESVCQAALEGGYRVWTYSVDTRADAERARSLGVEGLISNDLPGIA
ncbi:glycerophosphodiester phosphodiesterase [Nonomuraea wenchangensis]|uniref:Glycerophosphoryl diester phosphodiesterase n=1 Tax=Nonomuraea wenchangensis TaxID=568860 RepID=A0A1I0LRL1_9ACTN|nr:glycerophosphodiester phosphodiesterase [Nonomuraea wenchangensis]SEU43906.1 glycerophosphoryl diester phosphodiesterase [Nonomuraea wenchangensis]